MSAPRYWWAAEDRCPIEGGELRLLTALEVLQARREADELARDGTERALCANACLLARALERDGKPVYADGRAVLAGLRVEEIGTLSGRWAQFNASCNPSPTDGAEVVDAAKKAWSTRLMRAFAGVCCAVSARCRPSREPGA